MNFQVLNDSNDLDYEDPFEYNEYLDEDRTIMDYRDNKWIKINPIK